MNLTELSKSVHQANSKWWRSLKTGKKIKRNKGETMLLIVSEIIESFEGVRKGLMDDKLPEYPMEHVEMVDTLIRTFDYCGAHKVKVQEVFDKKMAFNANREDHKPENRLKEGGKKF